MNERTEQKKTERLHMLISPSELEEIDEWRFDNRIGTRAEAVRRLVQIGLRTTRVIPSLAKGIADVLDKSAEATDIPEAVIASASPDSELSAVNEEIAHQLFDAVQFIFNDQIDSQDTLYRWLAELAPLITDGDFTAALARADSVAGSEVRDEEALESFGQSRRAHVERWRRRRESIRGAKRKVGE